MGKIGGIALGVILVIVGFLLLPGLIGSTHSALTTNYTETYAPVTTGAGVTTANVTLSLPLYNANIAEIESITSNNTLDHPSAQLYVESSGVLQVKALAESENRLLTVKYTTADDSGYTGFDTFMKLSPMLIVLGLLGIIAVALIARR